MNKKGAELSMNVIVIAAIVLLVLVVLSIIFLGRIGIFGKSVGDCATKGGVCVAREDCTDITRLAPGTNCEKDEPGTICCVKATS